jgi:serine/threonine protein kinase
MSITEAAPYDGSSGDLCCPQCGKPLLPQATFCSFCGERLDKKKALSSLMQDEQDISNRYRISSLVRRRPYVNLYFALDNQQARQGQQCIVAIRDIDINTLHNETRSHAIELAQQEYDLLRLWRLPHVMPVVDMRYFHGHLFVVSSYPQITSSLSTTGMSENPKASTSKVHRLYTLQDFLQSGQGLPSEQKVLKWMEYLCQAIDGLNRHQIIIGELDPYTIILNENSENTEPVLMISWIPSQLQRLLRSSQASTRFWSYFCAPEALQGKAELRSDIYSLGAILYLLLTGSPPGARALRTKEQLRSPRELNGHISAHVNDCVMQALSIQPSKRFQNALELSEALFNPHYSRLQTLKLSRHDNEVTHPSVTSEDDDETIRIVPHSQKHVDRWRALRPQTTAPGWIPRRPLIPRVTQPSRELEEIQAEWQQPTVGAPQSGPVSVAPTFDTSKDAQSTTTGEHLDKQEASVSRQTPIMEASTAPLQQTSQNTATPTWKQRVSIMVPAISFEWLKKSRNKQGYAVDHIPVETVETVDTGPQSEDANTWFVQLQRLVLGRQQRSFKAAALIETPLYVQPEQVFTLRFHILGRDVPAFPPDLQEGDRSISLSGLVQGETLSIEVRAVLNQNDTFVVQHATVVVPGAGYVSEVTIPVQPLSTVPGGRRDRLHIFFFDKQHHPLYDKPFVIEVFVSVLVKRGHEGHQVLTISK